MSTSFNDNDRFNALEEAILQWFFANYSDTGLRAQINAAKLKCRKWTKVGFYVDLDVPENLSAVDLKNLGSGKWPLNGPQITSDDIEDGGGSLLWGKGGYISAIEMYAYGHVFKEEVKSFRLEQ